MSDEYAASLSLPDAAEVAPVAHEMEGIVAVEGDGTTEEVEEMAEGNGGDGRCGGVN